MILSYVLITRPANKAYHRLKEYEFNNRTDGGVVKFATYRDSVAHTRKYRRIAQQQRAGATVFQGALAVLILMWMWGWGSKFFDSPSQPPSAATRRHK